MVPNVKLKTISGHRKHKSEMAVSRQTACPKKHEDTWNSPF